MATKTAEPPVETAAKQSLSAYGPARSRFREDPSIPKHCAKSTPTGGHAIT